ncbi:unnamed protein product [Amoebophrya sp. A120]|nr:unnamed protein product [Amoebophrya sp. A120]|eukprot:GSA120T00017888001.1
MSWGGGADSPVGAAMEAAVDVAQVGLSTARAFATASPILGTTATVLTFVFLLSYVPYALTWLRFVVYMIVSSDAKGLKKAKPPSAAQLQGRVIRERQVYFLRHGESEWNWVFNKKPVVAAPFRLVVAFVRELLLGFADSLFLDSPLNGEGLRQASEMADDVEARVPSDAEFVTSPLRRAISTLLLAFPRRLRTKKVRVLHCLQEISRNVDTASMTQAREIPTVSAVEEAKYPVCASMYRRNLDVSQFDGNKTLSRTGLTRLREFAGEREGSNSVFRGTGAVEKPLVVAGHSLWFKHFFNLYLPPTEEPELAMLAKTRKIANGGLVSFKLQLCVSDTTGQPFCRIPAGSIHEVYKGFERPSSKKTA